MRALLLSLDCFTLPLIHALLFWVLSKEVSSTIFKVFGMTWPGIELRPLANTLLIRTMRDFYFNHLNSSLCLFIFYISFVDYFLFYTYEGTLEIPGKQSKQLLKSFKNRTNFLNFLFRKNMETWLFRCKIYFYSHVSLVCRKFMVELTWISLSFSAIFVSVFFLGGGLFSCFYLICFYCLVCFFLFLFFFYCFLHLFDIHRKRSCESQIDNCRERSLGWKVAMEKKWCGDRGGCCLVVGWGTGMESEVGWCS